MNYIEIGLTEVDKGWQAFIWDDNAEAIGETKASALRKLASKLDTDTPSAENESIPSSVRQ